MFQVPVDLRRISEMYKPEFRFRDNTIYDRGIIVAEFADCSLKNVRVSPRGEPVFMFFQLHWRFYQPDELYTSVVDELSVAGEGTDRLILSLKTHDPKDRGSDKRTVILTYDAGRDSYVFDVQGCFKVAEGKRIPTRSMLEYTDPYPFNAVGPAFDFPGKWNKRWDMFVYDGIDGNIYQAPHHHLKAVNRSIRIPPGGRFALVYDEKCNPVLEIPDETADESFLGVCPWIHDIHLFRYVGDPSKHEEVVLEEGTELPCHYRLYQLTPDEAKTMLSRSRPTPLTEYDNQFWRNLPPVLNPSTFDTVIDPHDSCRPGEIEPFPWQPYEDGKFVGEGNTCIWDRRIGRKDNFSVRLERSEEGVSAWTTATIGPSFFAPPWPEGEEYEITAYVRTEQVRGAGVYIAAQFGMGGELIDESRRYYKSKTIVGTNNWTQLRCVVSEKASGYRLRVELRLDGAGKAWFDDVFWSPYGEEPFVGKWGPPQC